jgi:hypothetical protein
MSSRVASPPSTLCCSLTYHTFFFACCSLRTDYFGTFNLYQRFDHGHWACTPTILYIHCTFLRAYLLLAILYRIRHNLTLLYLLQQTATPQFGGGSSRDVSTVGDGRDGAAGRRGVAALRLLWHSVSALPSYSLKNIPV